MDFFRCCYNFVKTGNVLGFLFYIPEDDHMPDETRRSSYYIYINQFYYICIHIFISVGYIIVYIAKSYLFE